MLKVFHMTAPIMAVTLPIAFCGFMPNVIQHIADDTLAFLFPFHGFVGLNFVISDYVPKKWRGSARLAAFFGMFVAFAGLYKLNSFGGPGIAKTVKQLWVKTDKKKTFSNWAC